MPSRLAQWQSIALLMRGLLVRVQHWERGKNEYGPVHSSKPSVTHESLSARLAQGEPQRSRVDGGPTGDRGRNSTGRGRKTERSYEAWDRCTGRLWVNSGSRMNGKASWASPWAQRGGGRTEAQLGRAPLARGRMRVRAPSVHVRSVRRWSRWFWGQPAKLLASGPIPGDASGWSASCGSNEPQPLRGSTADHSGEVAQSGRERVPAKDVGVTPSWVQIPPSPRDN